MVARAWTTIILWLSTLAFSFTLLMSLTTVRVEQIGSQTQEVRGTDGLTQIEFPLYESFTDYAPDGYMLLIMSVILTLILVNLLVSYFVWRGAINLPAEQEMQAATRLGAATKPRIPGAKAKRDLPDDNRLFTVDDEYVTTDDGEFMTLEEEELKRRQHG